MTKVIYLAGGMQSDWRDHASRISGNRFIDPREMNAGIEDPAIYTENDLAAIREADGVLVFMSPDNPSGYGLSVELGYAHGLGKPVAWVDTLGDDWRSRYFGMHRQIGAVHKDFWSAIVWLTREMNKDTPSQITRLQGGEGL